jgi:uncharacterized membrane protein YedE/YeeE
MDQFYDWLHRPWPWYVAGPMIGLMVPLLLLLGNKSLGISSSLRHICAACIPTKIPFFHYDWKKESWNLFFVGGVLIGGFVAVSFMGNHEASAISPQLLHDLKQYNITDDSGLIPASLFNWHTLFTLRGFILMVIGGFLVGFGTRYAGGCTSGHSIMGISSGQTASIIATICFMAGGFAMTWLLLPFILRL